MPSFETDRRNMVLCYGLTCFIGDCTHLLKLYELVSIALFFNTRNSSARPLSQNRTAMPLNDDTIHAMQLESWHRGGVLQVLPSGRSCTGRPATVWTGCPE